MRAIHGVSTGVALIVAALVGGWRAGGERTWREAGPPPCSRPVQLERMPVDTSTDLRLVLNVPAYRLDVVEQGEVTRSIRVAIGQPKYRTRIVAAEFDARG